MADGTGEGLISTGERLGGPAIYASSVVRTTWKRSGTAVQLHMNCFVRGKKKYTHCK